MPSPTGVCYYPGGNGLEDSILLNPNVDGIVLGCEWPDVEPTEGNYVFDVAVGQSLASALAQLEAANAARQSDGVEPLWARLAIQVGGPKYSLGGKKRDWLFDVIDADAFTGGKYFTFYDSSHVATTIPVFWEPTLLAKHFALVDAVANYLSGHDVIKVVFATYCNAHSNDWNPGDISIADDGLGDGGPTNRWLTALENSGYSTFQEALTYAGTATFAAFHASFPDLMITTPIGRINNHQLNPGYTSQNRGRNIVADIIDAAVAMAPDQIITQANSLSAGVPVAPGTGSVWNDIYLLDTPHAAQMLTKAYGDAACTTDWGHYGASQMNANRGCISSTIALKTAGEVGVTYGTKWQEIYGADLAFLNGNNQDPNGYGLDVVAYLHSLLVQELPPRRSIPQISCNVVRS
jgi:hypothetical protein